MNEFTAAPLDGDGGMMRQSRFIAHAAPVKDQAATLKFCEAVADLAASHSRRECTPA